MEQQLTHLLLRPVLLGVGRLFFASSLANSSFRILTVDGFSGQSHQRLFCCFVDENVALMLRKVLF